jgi:hypothetical protein
MLNPSLSELLRGVAEALEKDILGKLEAPADGAQLAAAIDILRRVATAIPQITPASLADSRDIAETLLQLSEGGSDLGVDRDTVQTIAGELEGRAADLSLDVLERRNDALRDMLARAAAAGAEAGDEAAHRLVRGVLRRMIARELALGLVGSPVAKA